MTRTYPLAERTDVVDDMHGQKVLDPYRWLEDADDARTQEWGEQQSALLEHERESWSTRDTFAESVQALLGAGAVSLPVHRGARVFFTQRQPGQQFGVLFVREADGSERVLSTPWNSTPPAAPLSIRGNRQKTVIGSHTRYPKGGPKNRSSM